MPQLPKQRARAKESFECDTGDASRGSFRRVFVEFLGPIGPSDALIARPGRSCEAAFLEKCTNPNRETSVRCRKLGTVVFCHGHGLADEAISVSRKPTWPVAGPS